MFTGIITDIGKVVAKTLTEQGSHYKIACHYAPNTIQLGASIACDGCCLTVTNIETISENECIFSVDVSEETLRITTLDDWQEGQKINLERALRMGDEFGGHIVSGHIDGVGVIDNLKQMGNSTRYEISCPQTLKQFIASKGSVTLNGVSLTVNQVEDQRFSVNIIPHTMSKTTWSDAKKGTKLNLEIDVLARYALRAQEIKEETKT